MTPQGPKQSGEVADADVVEPPRVEATYTVAHEGSFAVAIMIQISCASYTTKSTKCLFFH